MNIENENKSATWKYILFIGIPVILVLGLLGYYYHLTNPLIVFTKVIDNAYEKIDTFITNDESDINITDSPFILKGNASFKTENDWNGLEDLQKYNYQFQLGLDYQKEQMNLEVGIKEQEKVLLIANLFQKKNQLYVACEQLLNNIIKINNAESLNFKDLKELENINFQTNQEDTKYILKRLKEILIKSLDKKYINREKTDININGENVKTTKIIYNLNQENQKRTINYIADEILKDETLLEKIAKFTNNTKEEIKKQLKDKKQINVTDDIKIILYTEGLNQNLIRATLNENTKDIISYIDYQNKKTIYIQNDVILTLKNIQKGQIEINYELTEEQATGTIKIKENQEQNDKRTGTIFLSLSSSELTGEFNLDYEYIRNQELKLPNTNQSVNMEDLSSEEILTILEKLQKIFKDTIFFKLFESNIM